MTPEKTKENLDKQLHEILNWHFLKIQDHHFGWIGKKLPDGIEKKFKSFDDTPKFDHFRMMAKEMKRMKRFPLKVWMGDHLTYLKLEERLDSKQRLVGMTTNMIMRCF